MDMRGRALERKREREKVRELAFNLYSCFAFNVFFLCVLDCNEILLFFSQLLRF